MRVWDRVDDAAEREREAGSRQAQEAPAHPRRVLIGGVGYRWHGDASLGLIASDELAQLNWESGIEVSDLGYGALYVAQDLADAQPPYDRLILLGAVERGREPGRIYRYRWKGLLPDVNEIQARIFEAGAGVIDLDHLLVIAQFFKALPDDVVVLEVEPVDVTRGEMLSSEMAEMLPALIALACQEALAPAHNHAQPAAESDGDER
ncbi:MAG: hypothetical protein KatS3mg057_2015 [Herpetosiphonaceae bacterium]|nr:MAG: hypothetical protein KatS3mg057_2015 [Herpetosiphonaceae bacterium]